MQDEEALNNSSIIATSAGTLVGLGQVVDLATGNVNLVETPGAAAGEYLLNGFQGSSNLALGAGIGAVAAYLTKQHQPTTSMDKAAVKKEAHEVMKREGEQAGKQYLADNKDGSPGKRSPEGAKATARRIARGAAIGAAASLVPTILGMRDQQKLAEQSESLM